MTGEREDDGVMGLRCRHDLLERCGDGAGSRLAIQEQLQVLRPVVAPDAGLESIGQSPRIGLGIGQLEPFLGIGVDADQNAVEAAR